MSTTALPSNTSDTPEEPSKAWFGPPPPPELMDNSSSLELLSQGAEARVWLMTLPTGDSNDTSKSDRARGRTIGGKSSGTTHVGSGIYVPKILSLSDGSPNQISTKSICKERFPKKYRHPKLDVSLTKNRTKAEARCLIRCRRADVPCPNVLGIGNWSNGTTRDDADGVKNSTNTEMSTSSSCLFLEYVDGCTVRQYFERRSDPTIKLEEGGIADEPTTKRARTENEVTNTTYQQQERITTMIDSQTLSVANILGGMVAKMHAAGVIHGDLTTSNVMIRNPLWVSNGDVGSWKPHLVLIDFGLASSTTPTTLPPDGNSVEGTKQQKQHKQQNNAEEKAVDLYVLERAFLSTHPESEPLVEEVWKGYTSFYEELDVAANASTEKKESIAGNDEKSEPMSTKASVGLYTHVVSSVMNRLEQVRLRGRKRECFG